MDWSATWGMKFNVSKCKVMHMGRGNGKCDYVMAGTVLEKSREEKDLGVIVQDTVKQAAQCAKAAKTAQSVLGQITRAFRYRDRKVYLQLYKQYVRPHLDFATQAWSPWQRADIEVLEKVQQRAVNMVAGLRSREYAERLKELGLTTLDERRHQADMLHMYKMCSNSHETEWAAWFRPPTAAAARTRRNADPLAVRQNYGRLELRRNFFTVRACDPWNRVPGEIKRARTAAIFKRMYARYRDAMI
jgi:hypothetical protein